MPGAAASPRDVFVTPELSGPPTGGTLYDRELILALGRAGRACERLSLDAARRTLEDSAVSPETRWWVDSLYLDALPDLARLGAGQANLGLIAHYLPSLVVHGDAWAPADLTPVERAALGAVGAIIAPSRWLARVLVSVGVNPERIRVIEPGVSGVALDTLPLSASPPASGDDPIAALLVGNVTPGKGIAPFLEALRACLGGEAARFVLVIIGDIGRDPGYAAECLAIARAPSRPSRSTLSGAVVFASAMPHAEVLRAMQQTDVVVSASRMEAYGMALAEARALGVPILARRGGNAEAHADAAAGGEIADTYVDLASALVRLSRDRGELAARRARAQGSLRRRSWDDAAREFLESMPRRQ